MPFDEEDDDSLTESNKNARLKKVSSKKSIFDGLPKKPSADEFNAKVDRIQERDNSYKSRAATLATKFVNFLADKTLKQNKSIFVKEVEKEVLTDMIALAVEINNDPIEKEGMGSLGWITLLFRISLAQRDRINELEYNLGELNKKFSSDYINDIINKQIQTLDIKKKSE